MESQVGERKRARNDNRSNNDGRTSSGTESRRGPTIRRRRGGRVQRNSRSSNPISPSLGEYFSPDLVSKFSLTRSVDNTENETPDRRVEDSPFRSPLHKSRRGLQETTPYQSRRGPHHLGKSHRTPQRSDISQAEGEVDLEKERRVRKCLWADEVDEAFCEADDLSDDEPPVDREPPKTPTKEQLVRRQKDIDYGKATQGYKNYLETVPRDQRGSKFPKTPDKHVKTARRTWDYTVRKWRRSLHNWDAEDTASDVPSPSQQTGRSALGSEGGEGLTPASSVASSPSDKGYVTTPDSRADRSLQDMEEEEQEDHTWLAEIEEFPPLPSSGKKMLWSEIMQEEEKRKEENLDERVKKLTIGNVDEVPRDRVEDEEEGAEEEEKAKTDEM